MSEENNELKSILEKLKVEIPYKWRVQSFSKNKPSASCVAYIDSRDVQDLLDANCLWSDRYYEVGKMLFCEITIYADGREYKRSDTGSESAVEKEKGHSSDAFKRAAVKFGIGRFLYNLPIKHVPANEKKTTSNYPYVVDANGKQVWDVTKFINDIDRRSPQAQSAPKTLPTLERLDKGQISRNWTRALATIGAGKDVSYLRQKFTISEEIEKLLLIESKNKP